METHSFARLLVTYLYAAKYKQCVVGIKRGGGGKRGQFVGVVPNIVVMDCSTSSLRLEDYT